jgi:hypothetical protein
MEFCKSIWRWIKRCWSRWFARTPAAPKSLPRDLPMAPPTILHLVVEPEHRPLCGASIRQPWTIDPASATCPECLRDGDALMLQWTTNNR